MVLVEQHVLYMGQNSKCPLWRGHRDVGWCYKREQFAVLWRFTVLECTTPGCDLRSHPRVVVAEFPNYSAEWPKILQSTPPLYICAVTVPECLRQVVLYGLAQTLSQRYFLLQGADVRATTLVITRAAVSKLELEPKPWFIFWAICECSASSTSLSLIQTIWEQLGCETFLVLYCRGRNIVFSYIYGLHD